MITVKRLLELGFVDKSFDKNGIAFRKNITSLSLEVIYYINEGFFRLQSTGDGFTKELKGIKSEHDLNRFWFYVTGDYCENEKTVKE